MKFNRWMRRGVVTYSQTVVSQAVKLLTIAAFMWLSRYAAKD